MSVPTVKHIVMEFWFNPLAKRKFAWTVWCGDGLDESKGLIGVFEPELSNCPDCKKKRSEVLGFSDLGKVL